MNGHIVCRSNANTGTEFQILLPKTQIGSDKLNQGGGESQGQYFKPLPMPIQ